MVNGLRGVSGGQVGVATMVKADEEKLPSLSCDLTRPEASDLSIYANLAKNQGDRYNEISVTVSINSVSSKLLGLYEVLQSPLPGSPNT